MGKRGRVAILLALTLMLCACGNGAGKASAALEKRVEVSAVAVDENGVLRAEVESPDYSALMQEVLDEAQSQAKEQSQLEQRLLELTHQAAGDAPELHSRTVEIDLWAQDPGKNPADWSEAELTALAREQALAAELDEFAGQILSDTLPGYAQWAGEVQP